MKLLKWLIPLSLVLVGILLLNFVYGHGFLGFISICLAIVISIYFLIGLLKDKHLMVYKAAMTVFSTLFGLVLGVCLVTEAIVIRASFGSPDTSCSYIVVLGAKVNGASPSISLSDRIDAAYRYLTENPDTVAILSGGKGEDEGISEAQCMFNELTRMGIDGNRLLQEDKATSTWENIQFSLDIIEEKTGTRPATIGLLSSEYHLFRASLFAKDCGVETVGIPAQTSWFTLKLNYFTREVAGIWHYIILGGQYHD